MKIYIFQVFTAAILMSLCSPALPPQIKPCHQSSALAECIKNEIQSLRPLLKTGRIAPGFVIEGIDPLALGDIEVNSGFELKLFKSQAFGVSNFRIEKIRVNIKNFKLEMIATIPHILLKGPYSLNMRIALLNLQGKGYATADIDSVRILLKIFGSRYLKKGVEYLKLDKVQIELQPGKIQVHFDNLFNGNKALEDVGNQVLNDNIDLLREAFLPEFQAAIERKFFKVANQVFERAPLIDFFPN